MNNAIIYHSADLDGRGSAFLVSNYLLSKGETDIETFGYNYEKNFPEVAGFDNVYIVDLSLKPEFLEQIASNNTNILWIDHHKTSIEYNQKTQHLTNLKVNIDINLSAIELTYKHFWGNDIPLPIELLGRYDRWDNTDLIEWEEKILPFQEYARLEFGHRISDIPLWILTNDGDVKSVIEIGKLLLKSKRQMYKGWHKKKVLKREFEGYTGLFINTSIHSSQVLEDHSEFNEVDFVSVYSIIGEGIIVSLYSQKIDVSEIAKKYGGGGHAGASGFRLDKKEDIDNFLHNIIDI